MKDTAIAIKISTSKRNRLWPAGHWKVFVDAVTRGGAKHDPRLEYPDLRTALDDLMEARNGRYWPKPGSPFSGADDSALKMLIVHRVKPGSESVRFVTCAVPDLSLWKQVEFPYFGTIGNSKYEAQTKRNREKLASSFTAPPSPAWLGLAFQLSQERLSARGRDRDIDNLADALMPFFNRAVKRFEEIVLVKMPPTNGENEILRYRCRPSDYAC